MSILKFHRKVLNTEAKMTEYNFYNFGHVTATKTLQVISASIYHTDVMLSYVLICKL